MNMTLAHSRAACEQLDQQDPLAALRDEFLLPDGVIYLDGNSLGARPKASLQRAQEVIAQEWGTDLIKSWNKAGWFDLPSTLGNQLAPLIGAQQKKWSSPIRPPLICSKPSARRCRCSLATRNAKSSSPSAAISLPTFTWPRASPAGWIAAIRYN
jgi:hypothetical protein